MQSQLFGGGRPRPAGRGRPPSGDGARAAEAKARAQPRLWRGFAKRRPDADVTYPLAGELEALRAQLADYRDRLARAEAERADACARFEHADAERARLQAWLVEVDAALVAETHRREAAEARLAAIGDAVQDAPDAEPDDAPGEAAT